MRRRAILGQFAIVVAVAMGLALRNGFVYDDWPAIVQNARVTDPALWHTIPRAPYWLGTLWRPFTVAMYAAQWWIGGGAPWLFHLVSLLGYLAVGWALFTLMERLGAAREGAAVMTMVFLAHPVHVEVVANVVGQAELWVALAVIGATVLYIHARATGTERRALMPLLALTTLGIVSKEQGFVLPLLLASAEWILFDERGERWRARVRLLVPVAALSALLFAMRGFFLDSATGETPAVALRGLSLTGRIETFLAVVPEWARLVIWPVHLQADYGPPGIPVGGAFGFRHLLGAAIVAFALACFIRFRRTNRPAAFGVAWFAVTIAPVSNLAVLSGIVMAERVLFLPTAGVIVTCCALVAARASASRAQLAALAVATLFAARSAIRVPTWQSQQEFFSDLTVDAPDAYRAWKVSAEYWDSQGDRTRAIAQLRHSLALWAGDYEVDERLGQMYRQDGRCELAIPLFTAGVENAPDQTSVRAKLIECLIATKQWDAALKVADQGIALGQDEFVSVRHRVESQRAKGP